MSCAFDCPKSNRIKLFNIAILCENDRVDPQRKEKSSVAWKEQQQLIWTKSVYFIRKQQLIQDQAASAFCWQACTFWNKKGERGSGGVWCFVFICSWNWLYLIPKGQRSLLCCRFFQPSVKILVLALMGPERQRVQWKQMKSVWVVLGERWKWRCLNCWRWVVTRHFFISIWNWLLYQREVVCATRSPPHEKTCSTDKELLWDSQKLMELKHQRCWWQSALMFGKFVV